MKKFVKCLLASGLLVGLLAGCNTKKPSSSQPSPSSEAPSSSSEAPSSSSSETPVPPEPPVPVKEEWTNAELRLFEQFDIQELPFDYELSIEDVQEGIVFAVSKDEVDVDAVEEYSTMLEDVEVTIEGEDYQAYTAVGEYFGGVTYDLELLGFDLDSADPVQYLRELDLTLENDYRYQNLVTVGLDLDGHLLVASATVCLPLFTGWEGIIGGGMEVYPLLYDTAQGREVDFLHTQITMVYSAMLQEQMTLAANALPFDDAIVHPEITKEVTCAASLNTAIGYPYFLSNIHSSAYDQSGLNLYFININGQTPVTYTQEDFDALIAQVQLSEALVSFDAETNVAIYNYNGSSIQVTYALTDFNEAGTLKCIEMDYVVLGYETPINEVGLLGSVAGYVEANHSCAHQEFFYEEDSQLGTDAYYYTAYMWDEIETILQLVENASNESGFYDELTFSREPYGPLYDGSDVYYAYLLDTGSEDISVFETYGDVIGVGYAPIVFYFPDYSCGVLQLESWSLTAQDFAAEVLENDVTDYYEILEIFGLDTEVESLYNATKEILESEGVTFTAVEAAYSIFASTIDSDYGAQIAAMSQSLLNDVAALSQNDYETSDWNTIQSYSSKLSEALAAAQSGEATYRNVFAYYYLTFMAKRTIKPWRVKYMEQLEAAYDAAFGWDEETQSYKYDDDDFDADAVAAANAAVDEFIDVYSTEGATAAQGKAKLNVALNKLNALTPDKQTLLDRLTDAYNGYDQSEYSETNWQLLTGYFETARDLIANEETSFDDGKAAYLQALVQMASVEKTHEAQLRDYFAGKFHEENYLPETWTAFLAFLEQQVQTITDAAEEDKEDAALAAMIALDEWLVNFYKAKLQVEFDACDPDDFPDHYSELESVYASCISTIENATSETDMAGAIQYFLQQRDALINNAN